MAISYTVSGSTEDGTLISEDMQQSLEFGYIYVTFFTDSTKTTQIQPSSGTITFEATETGFNWGVVDNGVIDTSVVAYDRMSFAGPIRKVKVTCLDIVGADFYEATITRFSRW